MAPNSMQEALNSPKDAVLDPSDGNDVNAGGGGDYYAKGSAELATENALTLAKIQHVSVHFF